MMQKNCRLVGTEGYLHRKTKPWTQNLAMESTSTRVRKRNRNKKVTGNGVDGIEKNMADDTQQKKAPKICHQFQAGNCTYGTNCKFSHDTCGATASTTVSKDICRKYLAGVCKRGDTCRYSHDSSVSMLSHSNDLPSSVDSAITSKTGQSSAQQEKKSSVTSYMTQSLFSSLPISALTKRALEESLQYSNLSVVQEASIFTILEGTDVLVKAKTGTGKTLAFLIPSIEVLLRHTCAPDRVRSIILSPTRELAMQIAAEAETLLSFHTGMRVVTVVGGTNINSDKNRLRGGVDILVATPGRLNDHFENTDGFSDRCMQHVKFLIFDEADRLLDMGFKQEVDKILIHVPPKV